MASRIEHDMAKSNKPSVKPNNTFNKKKSVSQANEKDSELFKDLFGE